ncbi:MAG TPA: hypothetical protein VID27_14345 [Blastocatellia bacterium]|jgi:hypothetical protein
MRKTIVFLLISASLAFAQDKPKDAKPDFSGTWAFDHSKSSLGPFERSPAANAEITLVITHKEPELKIVRKINLNGNASTQEFTYYSDGRGETNPAAFGNGEVKSKTKWDKMKLESKSSSSYQMRGGGDVFHTDTAERRELSQDGKTLTITISISGPRGIQIIKTVYNRSES